MNLHVLNIEFQGFSTLLLSTVEHVNLRKSEGGVFFESILVLKDFKLLDGINGPQHYDNNLKNLQANPIPHINPDTFDMCLAT